MIVTELYNGQGLGNQLWCYAVTRCIALQNGYSFGIMSPRRFKGRDFLHLDFGSPVIGGVSPEGGPPRVLPEGITAHYTEQKVFHPLHNADIRVYDPNLIHVADNTKIDGVMQDEQYVINYRDEIRTWFKIDQAHNCTDFSDENTCVINFRGGEYTRHPELFLSQNYWDMAIEHMLRINPRLRFVVITEDVRSAKKYFKNIPVYHFFIGKDYSIIHNAQYLILSNSSFAWFPAWTSTVLKKCIAPKYWGRHNVSDGYWSPGYALTTEWWYLDRLGVLSSYETCAKELQTYQSLHEDYYLPGKMLESPQPLTILDHIRPLIPTWLSLFIRKYFR